METTYSKINHQGKEIFVPSRQINGRNVIVTGRFIRTAAIQDETCIEGEIAPDPDGILAQLKEWKIKPDIFTFSQKVTDPKPRFPFKFEWENFAVIPITSYDDWFRNRVKPDVRQNIGRAEREGVIIRCVPYDDEFVQGVKEIYDESSVRQGRRFWHYGKSFKYLKDLHGTYLSRAEYIGAYFRDDLIGFIKMVYVGKVARTMNVIAKQSHFRLRPVSALIAKAVQICEQRKVSYLVYGEYRFPGKAKSSFADFKKRNGFEEVLYPRYFIPLTAKGSLAVGFGLHRGLERRVPPRLRQTFVNLRSWLYASFETICGLQGSRFGPNDRKNLRNNDARYF
jgi:hypothetical protein